MTADQSPVCRHFGTCGGCAHQDQPDDVVAAWKRARVAEALAGVGLEAPIRRTLTSPPQSRRRAVLTGRRTKKTVMLGFHERRSHALVDVTECPVMDPAIVAAFDWLRLIVRLAASRTSHVRITVTVSDAGLDVDVGDARPLEVTTVTEIAGFAHDLARLSWNGEVVLQDTPPYQTFGAARVTPPPGAFLQATPQGEAALVAAVTEGVGDAARVVDLFSGCGTFTLPLAARADVLAVEADAAMLKALDAGWRQAQGLHQVRTEARDLFRRPLLPAEFKHVEAVVIDPPRAGAEAQTAELAQTQVPRIAFVSCNPATFARDAATLVSAGYVLDWIDVIDQFRWSNHVELVSRFTRS